MFKFSYLFFYFLYLSNVFCVYSHNINVNIDSETVENVISDKFISFTVDPYKLLRKNGPDENDECLCMAQSLAPAYIKIGGFPIKDIVLNQTVFKLESTDKLLSKGIKSISQTLSIEKWKKFVNWSKKLNIIPVITLDSSDRYINGNWNSASAIKILTIADKSELENCVWILNYDCERQTLESYLNDLKTLKIVLDSFRYGRNGSWKISSAEISKCLDDSSSHKFKDFILNASFIIDSFNLDLHSEKIFENLDSSDKEIIINDLSQKDTHLWKNYDVLGTSVEEKAFNWLQILGEAAKQGYSSVFKILDENELNMQTLNYYISLIHKKFVGPEVLKLTMESYYDELEYVSIYGHCAVLPNMRIQNGVTLLAMNSGDFDSNVTFNVSLKDDGGDIMLFGLKMENETLLLNGKEMMFEGDLQPMMLQIPSTEALRILLPSKSILFVVITNTNLDICSSDNGYKKESYRELNHKKLQSEDTAKVLQDLLTANWENSRKTRSVDEEDWESKLAHLLEKNENIETAFADEQWEKIISNARQSRQYSNYTDLFETLGKIMIMVDLENEFIEIGKTMLNSTNNDTNVIDELEDDTTLKPLIRVIRDLEDAEMIEDVEATTVNKEVETVKNDESKSPLIVQPDIEQTKQTLDKLIERAREVLNGLNVTLDTDKQEDEIVALGESEPLKKGIKNPELFLKKELLKSKIKLKELKNKIKARVAEFELKTKMKSALPHKILKREIFRGKRYVISNSIRDNFPNEKYYVKYSDKNDNVDGGFESEISDKNNEGSGNDGEITSEKNLNEDTIEDISSDKLTWSDLTEKFGGLEESEDTLTKIVNNFSNFLNNIKNKFNDAWKSLTTFNS